jgi:toxin ParE1/3/4
MTQVVHSQKARFDLSSIWPYIAGDNPNAADRLLDSMGEKRTLLGENPKLGQARPDISPTMRFFPVKNYLIHQEQPSGVEIVRVPHGSRDVYALFDCNGACT